MRARRRCAIGAAVLLCSNALAWAASAVPVQLSDDLALSGAQEQLIWHRLAKPSTVAAQAPAAVQPSIYGPAPTAIVLHSMPADITREIPMVRRYKYAMLNGMLLIVNPSDGKIVDIITP